MNIVEVYHKDHLTEQFQHVANVNVTELVERGTEIWEILEYVYRWTNNIEGSWSNKGLDPNPDLNENVEVLVPLHEHEGKTYGLRSTSIDDVAIYEGKTYKVATFGFDEVISE